MSDSSHVLAAGYSVATPSRWWEQIRGHRPELGRLSAQHLVVYRAVDDPNHFFVTIGIRHRGPLDRLLRSGVVLDWFDAAGVGEIPPLFAGDVIEKIDLTSGDDPVDDHPGVIVAAVAPVADVAALVALVHSSLARYRRAGVRKVWLYGAIDDGHEVMILQEVDTLEHARAWLRHPEALAQWMAGVGVGVYPPVFVGTLDEVVEADTSRRG